MASRHITPCHSEPRSCSLRRRISLMVVKTLRGVYPELVEGLRVTNSRNFQRLIPVPLQEHPHISITHTRKTESRRQREHVPRHYIVRARFWNRPLRMDGNQPTLDSTCRHASLRLRRRERVPRLSRRHPRRGRLVRQRPLAHDSDRWLSPRHPRRVHVPGIPPRNFRWVITATFLNVSLYSLYNCSPSR